MATAIVASRGANTISAASEPQTSKLRFRRRDEWVRPYPRTPRSGVPSTSSSATDQPTTSSSRGSRVTFTPTDLISRILSSSRSPAGVVLESITTRSMRCVHSAPATSVRLPSTGSEPAGGGGSSSWRRSPSSGM